MKEAGETVFMVQTICLRVLILNIIWLISQILTVKSTTGSYKMGKTGKRRKLENLILSRYGISDSFILNLAK